MVLDCEMPKRPVARLSSRFFNPLDADMCIRTVPKCQSIIAIGINRVIRADVEVQVSLTETSDGSRLTNSQDS